MYDKEAYSPALCSAFQRVDFFVQKGEFRSSSVCLHRSCHPAKDTATELLLAEMWQHISNFLTLQEICKLSSTCKALWRLDLISVKVVRESATPAGRILAAPVHLAYLAKWCAQGLICQHVMHRHPSTSPPLTQLACVAALQWAAKRWGGARLLELDMRDMELNDLVAVLACGSPLHDLSGLHEVCLC